MERRANGEGRTAGQRGAMMRQWSENRWSGRCRQRRAMEKVAGAVIGRGRVNQALAAGV